MMAVVMWMREDIRLIVRETRDGFHPSFAEVTRFGSLRRSLCTERFSKARACSSAVCQVRLASRDFGRFWGFSYSTLIPPSRCVTRGVRRWLSRRSCTSFAWDACWLVQDFFVGRLRLSARRSHRHCLPALRQRFRRHPRGILPGETLRLSPGSRLLHRETVSLP